MGSDLARKLAIRAQQKGLQSSQLDMSPINVAVIGNGAQPCKYDIYSPIAIQFSDDQNQKHTFKSPIVEGPDGSKLPGLLGFQSLEKHRCIRGCGDRQQNFVSDGDVEIKLLSGSITVPLEKVPSGHLAMVIDDFEHLQSQQGGVPTSPMNLHTSLPGQSGETAKFVTCGCGDRDCAECGQPFLSQHSEPHY